MKIEVIMATGIDEMNQIIAERKPDRVDGVRIHDRNDLRYGVAPEVMNQWTEYTAVLYWDDFCEWTTECGGHFVVGCKDYAFAQRYELRCHICGKPVRVRIVEPKP